MPKRNDLNSVLIIGAGPIVIGQACEFDYSGAQACKALREEGIRVILVNSNPATIMTDPTMADATYIEPVEWHTVSKIIEKERPDALLPTMGGQTALNCALDLSKYGVLNKYNVEMIGANANAIDKAEDREKFDIAMRKIGLTTPNSGMAHSLEEANQIADRFGFPCIIRPSFTMGGSGGGIAYNREEFVAICRRGLDLSPTNELLIDESLIGWKEFEMEVMRDCNDNCIIVCSIENFDPMGIHTGDSITVAPAQTLTDKEYQLMRNASVKILREIGIETGGSNVQFAVNPAKGDLVVIEMNPRVSRSSALASKATGFPIAKIAAKLSIGYTLNELRNEITGGRTPASFEPTIDYIVTKVPRFAFEKFNEASTVLTTQMKSVGEVMAIGRTFQESLQKALRGLEMGFSGLDPLYKADENDLSYLKNQLSEATPERIWFIGDAFRVGMTRHDVHSMTNIDSWFLSQIEDLISEERALETASEFTRSTIFRLKRKGFSDRRLAELTGTAERAIRTFRWDQELFPVYKRVDTCAAEFATDTAYMYSTYEEECESQATENKKILILGGGPNRIGQGIEFDYCCVHASLALREEGFETIMVNCNPETVSTDFDISDRLYFEPVTLEDVLEIIRVEKPCGVIVQFGGQTPLRLARSLENEGVNIIGTSPDAIDRAEDRERFQHMIKKLALLQPHNATARSIDDAVNLAQMIGYPLVVRPSYVLGGRAMEIVYKNEELLRYMETAVSVGNDAPVLLDLFLPDAIEVDVDVVSDGDNIVLGAIMQHIEQAGIHSGDSACSLPPYSLSADVRDKMRHMCFTMARELGVVGLMNVQLAIQDGEIYVIEVNPRASRTIPFVSKCIGISLAKIAAKCMTGTSLKSLGFTTEIEPILYGVKESVFPFNKFPGIDPILGPEMKSTGEVMGIGASFAEAYGKAQLGSGEILPSSGNVFISVRDRDKQLVPAMAMDLVKLGFNLFATRGTAEVIKSHGISVSVVNKVKEGRPHIVDMIKSDQIDLIINTTEGRKAISDSSTIRSKAEQHKVYYTTTMAGGRAVCEALKFSENLENITVRSLQSVHREAGI
tara:strand:- start:19361 stop:22582 length:3222 start_codon:yes stop_codon:yes gene_type:complete